MIVVDPPGEFAVRQQVPRDAMRIIEYVATRLGKDPTWVIYPALDPAEPPSPWVCFDVGARKFGIWRATMELYEGDEHGAMGDDPIDPRMIRRSLFGR